MFHSLSATRTLVLALLAMFIAPLSASDVALAQELTADEAVRKSIEALGGPSSWNAIQSLRYSGSFSTFSRPRPFVVYRQRGDFYRFEHFYEAGKRIFVHDGQLSWWINEAIGAEVPWPEPAPPVRARAIRADADFPGPLHTYKEKGHRLELAGSSDLDGEATIELVVHLAQGGVEHWHLDPQSFLPKARLLRGVDTRQEVEQRDFFTDYREVSGVLIPHHFDIELDFRYQSLEIDEVVVNPELDPELFRMPIAGMDRLRNMAGSWIVEVESRTYPRSPWTRDEVTSTIRPFFHGGLLAEEISYLANASRRQLHQDLSYDRFRHVFRLTRFDSLTTHVTVLEGTFHDDRLVLTNLQTATSWKIKDVVFHTRDTFHEHSPDSFKVEREISSDAGKTWDVLTRLTYSRKTD